MPEQYGEQIPVKPGGSERVDFAVKLPGSKEGTSVYLPIDSKFPGDTYAGLLAAYDSGDPEQLKEKRNLLEAEIKRCAKSIQSKYIVPPHTTDFAIMFLPFEGLYAEVVNMGLVETLQKNYKVNIAGTIRRTDPGKTRRLRTCGLCRKASRLKRGNICVSAD